MKKLKLIVTWIWKQVKRMARGYAGLYKRRPWWVRLLVATASVVAVFFLYLGAVDVNLLWLFGRSPSMSTIKNKRPAQASEIFSADGQQIGKYFSENRTPVEFDDVAECFWQALICTEDERFYHHHGIDFQAFAAALKDYVVHHDARGASTLTQQLAKNLFRARTEYSTGLLGNVPGLKMLIMKSKEWIMAMKLEAVFSKEEILTMYANTVDFGSNAFGIKTACKTYFDCTPRQLTPDQAAVLVGMLKATTYYNPLLHPDHSRQRRNTVLANMLNHGHIDRTAFDTLSAKDIALDYSVETTYDGEATYFREALAQYLKNWCSNNGYNLYTDGLKIYTTVDTRMQRYAEQSARKQMQQVQRLFDAHWAGQNPWQDERHQEIKGFIEGIARRLPVYKRLAKRFDGNEDSIFHYLNQPHTVRVFDYEHGHIEREMSTMDSIRYMERFMHCGFVAIEPETRHVKAWVGDVDFGTWKYDKVTAMRQPGSTFKLFVYTEAMNQGLTPNTRRVDSPFSMKVWDPATRKERYWTPTNANGYFTYDSLPLKNAFAMSINSVAVKLGQEVGIDQVIETAHAMGIKSPLDPTPSLALGASDVQLLELVNAYATVVNDGRVQDAQLVTRIEDRDGRVIYAAPTEQQQAISRKTAFLMRQMLMAGMREAGGTSMNLWTYTGCYPDTEFGGKTGTSNNHSDAWFVGVSPHLVCGAWVGGEYRAIHFRTGQLGQGSRTALPICGLFFERVMGDEQLQKYHGRFIGKEGIADLDDNMYVGTLWRPRRDSDSLATDTVYQLERVEATDISPASGGQNGESHTSEPQLDIPDMQLDF